MFGQTPHQLRTEARIHRAKALLTEGMPVTRVCFEVGFQSVGSFSTLFARRVGVPPSRWRPAGATMVAVPARPTAPGCLDLMTAAFAAWGTSG